MKSALLFIGVLFFSFQLQAGVITLTGKCKGVPVFIQNPYDASSNEFCIVSVYVNKEQKVHNPNTSAVEVSLEDYMIGDVVELKIVYRRNCKPTLVNPHALQKNKIFDFHNILIRKDYIRWVTRGERYGGKMEVEIFEGERWITIFQEKNHGGLSDNIYEIPSYHHSGENIYRICYTAPDGEKIYSHEYYYRSSQAPASFYPSKVEDVVYFHAEKPVFFQVYDKEKNLVLEGRGKTADCKILDKGKYKLYFDNQEEKFKKK